MHRKSRSTCVVIASVLVFASACGLSINGADPQSSVISPDASSDDVATTAHADAASDAPSSSSSNDAAEDQDAAITNGDDAADGAKPPTCIPIVNAAGSLVAPDLAMAPTLDGHVNAAEWQTCFVHLDKTNASTILDNPNAPTELGVDLTVAHVGQTLYIGARVTGAVPLGNHSAPNLNYNDSLELYFDADGMTTQAYGSDSLQLIVDHKGGAATFRYPIGVGASNITTSVSNDGVSKYEIEVAVVPATFGVTAFAKTIGFDFALNDGDGNSELSELVWFQKCSQLVGGCGCPDGSGDAPWCDARQFGSILLK